MTCIKSTATEGRHETGTNLQTMSRLDATALVSSQLFELEPITREELVETRSGDDA